VITRVRLRNYRAHENTDIKFGNIAGFTGDNQHGKSSIFKAVRMVLLNEPFPEKQIRRGTKEAAVIVDVEFEGKQVTIERTRTLKEQTTTITIDGVTTHYKGQKGLDDIIRENTGFTKVKLDNASEPESLQIINAHDFQFLSTASPDSLMRKLVKLMSGVGIETAKVNIEKQIRGLQTELSAQEAILAAHTKSYNTVTNFTTLVLFDSFDAIKAEVEQVDQELAEIESRLLKIDLIANLQEILSSIDTYSTLVQEYKQLTQNYKDVESALENYRYTLNLIKEVKHLDNKISLVQEEIKGRICINCGYQN
jgi:DNA repair exonuclease SbcCD ATPase subunit